MIALGQLYHICDRMRHSFPSGRPSLHVFWGFQIPLRVSEVINGLVAILIGFFPSLDYPISTTLLPISRLDWLKRDQMWDFWEPIKAPQSILRARSYLISREGGKIRTSIRPRKWQNSSIWTWENQSHKMENFAISIILNLDSEVMQRRIVGCVIL